MDKPTTARIPAFMRRELDELRADLHAAGMKIADKDDIPNALILAARRSPIEAVAAVIQSYWRREADEQSQKG